MANGTLSVSVIDDSHNHSITTVNNLRTELDSKSNKGHTHTESEITDLKNYELAFTKNTAFNKNFGTVAGTVSEGNHVHTEADISDLQNYSLSGHSHTESDITDLQSYALSGHTHVSSDITDATDSATANKIMQRNSAGDVWCRLFRSTYTGTNSNIAGIYTTQIIGGDYMRPSTPAQLQTALDVYTNSKVTISTSSPSGGSNKDVWYQV